jgi:hypothetical protein
MDERFEERFAALANNLWISFINSNYLVWDAIMRKLKLIDIVSLVLVTSFCIKPLAEVIRTYLK